MASSASSPSGPKRFYAEAGVRAQDDGWVVALDGRVAKTPAGRPLALPTLALGELVAAEWTAQGDTIARETMPATRLACTVLDRSGEMGGAVAAEIARYASADVLCYFADGPEALVRQETEAWGPILDWARDDLGVALVRAEGVTPVAQPPEALARVEALAAALEPFAQGAVALATPLYGSAILALAVSRGRLGAEAAFELSRLDEAFQEARWGVDAEAAARTDALRAEARFLSRWFAALRKA